MLSLKPNTEQTRRLNRPLMSTAPMNAIPPSLKPNPLCRLSEKAVFDVFSGFISID